MSETTPPPDSRTQRSRIPLPNHIVIRLDREVRADDFQELGEAARASELHELADLLERIGVRVPRLITTSSVPEIREQEERARDSDWPPLESLTQYWRMDLGPQKADLPLLAERLASLPGVELAYVETPLLESGPAGVISPGSGTSAEAHVQAATSYLDAAANGINARYAWNRDSRGSDVRVLDVEQAWNFRHEAIVHLARDPIFGRSSARNALDDGSHGTAVLGILAGQRSGENPGVDGICPKAEVLTASHYDGDSLMHVAAALDKAHKTLRPGDVVLLEVTNGAGYPIERDLAVRAKLRNLAADGIVVVEAAGNAATQLERLPKQAGKGSFVVSEQNDSGAILVGSARATLVDGRYARLGSSNFGSRVNCFAWGERVFTSGCASAGCASPDTAYRYFGGTSAASAIVAGAVVLIQSLRRDESRRPLRPRELRELMSDPAHGTSAVGGWIGVMPDVERVIGAAPG